MPFVLGVDGCPAGWLAVAVEYQDDIINEDLHLCASFGEVLELRPRPQAVAVDIPIGLLEEVREGGRECDRALRQILGSPRSSSVFSPPVRPALACATFEEGRRWSLNRQSFAILSRAREVDTIMTPALQDVVREVHPELCFFVLDGLKPMEERKKSAPGVEERKRLLQRHFHQLDQSLSAFPRSKVGTDDVLDAYAAAWTALRMFRGEAGRVPDDPPLDAKGLRMEVWY